jgi:RND superfamily putative drug exporter
MPIPTDADDSDAATEQLNSPGQSDNGDRRRRGGGGLSAQDLLRREGRL